MSDAIKHECGIALLRLKKPLEFYIEKYGRSVLDMQEEEPDTNHYLNAVYIGRALAKSFY